MQAREPSVGGSIGAAIGKAAASTAKKTARSTNRSRSSSVGRRSGGSSSGGGSSRRSSSSGGSRSSSRRSSGGSSGGRNVSTPAPKPPAPKPPVPPSLATYLGTDSVYQQAVRGGNRSLTDFLSEIGRRRGEANTQFTQTKASMERDRVQQLEDLREEFASRGLIQSGLYGEEQGRFQKQFTEQSNALAQQQAALLNDLLSQEKSYRRENDLALEVARQEAIARRAAKYKIG